MYITHLKMTGLLDHSYKLHFDLRNNRKMEDTYTSDRRRWAEIIMVVTTGALKYVFMDWLNLRAFYIAAACIFWIVYIFNRYRKDKQILQKWGFRKDRFRHSFLFLLTFAVVMVAGIIWYGVSVNAIFLNWHIIPIFMFYPAWGIIQQFLMVALVAGNLQAIQSVEFNNWQILLLTSLVFSGVHYPDLPLMVFTFFMETIFLVAYFKWRNLWALGLYHGWVASLLLFFVLGRDLWDELWTIL